jgi:uncharacterized protein (DUF2235 family)
MTGPKHMKQVWFPGVHCDVGGGYPECESGLSKLALKWMIVEAAKAGLIVDTDAVDLVLGYRGQGYARPDPNAPRHESMTRWWRPVEYLPRPHWDQNLERSEWRANRMRPRSWPAKPVVHDAAWQRDSGAYAGCLPKDAIPLSEAERRPGVTAEFDVDQSNQQLPQERA